MNIRIFILASMVSLIGTAAPSRLMAQAVQSSEDKCEEAIAQKVKKAKKPETVTFASDARRSVPHGLLTHYAGKGFYAVPGGGNAEFEWFCDVTGADGRPENLFYSVSKVDAPAKKAEPEKEEAKKDEAKKDEPKPNAKPNKPWIQECQSVVESVIQKKNPSASQIDFQSAKVSRASNSEDLVEGEGSFAGKSDEEVKFDYRCAYNVEKGKITAKSVQMK